MKETSISTPGFAFVCHDSAIQVVLMTLAALSVLSLLGVILVKQK